jgi:group I intron endonuclease
MADGILADVEASGIYQIRNLVNGKRYIGSAKSFKVRWAKHLGDLRLGRHHSAYLQRSWGIHGSGNFAFEIVELCAVPDLIQREQSWLDAHKPEYNVSPTAANCTGVKHSDATKLKHTLAMKGRKFPEAAAKRTGQKRTPESELLSSGRDFRKRRSLPTPISHRNNRIKEDSA